MTKPTKKSKSIDEIDKILRALLNAQDYYDKCPFCMARMRDQAKREIQDLIDEEVGIYKRSAEIRLDKIESLEKETQNLIDKAVEKERKRILEMIGKIKKLNPYPADIFIEPTQEQYAKFNQYLKNMGLYPDAYNGATGRRIWNMCIGKLIKGLEGE